MTNRDIQDYLFRSFGLETDIRELDFSKTEVLPLYLKGNYRLYSGQLCSRPIIWAEPVEDFNLDQLSKQEAQLEQLLHSSIAFVFRRLDAWMRQRLVQRRVGFLQIGKQLYLPHLLMELSDVPLRSANTTELKAKLNPPAQTLLIYHLLKSDLEKRPFGEIAKILSYSPMTITRAARELVGHGLAEIAGTREKQLRFLKQEKKLWEEARPFLNSPVKEEWFVDELPASEERWFWQAGDTALEHYADLSSGSLPVYAVYQEKLSGMKRDPHVRLNKKYGHIKIQSWSYDPALLGVWPVADPLSVYLSIKNKDDERIDAALKKLINSQSW